MAAHWAVSPVVISAHDGHSARIPDPRRRLADQAERPDSALQPAPDQWPRFPWDIPVEDFLFSFALLTLVLLLWVKAGPGRLEGAR